MSNRFKFRLPFYDNKGTFTHFQYFDIIKGLEAYNAGVMYNKGEYEQCTGLSDKNGNLIYEGDILLLYNNKFEVGNNNITVFFKCLTDKYTHIDPMDFDYNESEIIGNVHEQAERKDVK